MSYKNDELHLKFSSYSELSFFDDKKERVQILLNGNYVGDTMVYTDDENDNREYIIINYEVIYLDNLIKI